MARSEISANYPSGLTAATKQRSARPWGSLPKGCNKMRSYRSATAPWRLIMCMERQQGHTAPWKPLLGAGTDCI